MTSSSITTAFLKMVIDVTVFFFGSEHLME